MASKYQIYKDIAGQFRFRLKTENDKIVVVSEAYEQHEGALNGVKSIQSNCTVAIEDLTVEAPRMIFPKFQVYEDKASMFRFRLTASNGQTIGASEAYETKEACLSGIKAMQESCNAETEDLTITQMAMPPVEPVMQPVAAAVTPIVASSAATVSVIEMAPPPSAPLSSEPMLELDKLPEHVEKGTVIYFKGKLSMGNLGVPKAKIRIFEHDRSFMLDAAWAKGYTEPDGTFNLATEVTPPHFWDNSAKIYAQADADNIKQVRSAIQQIVIE